jgi:hypothetical protein
MAKSFSSIMKKLGNTNILIISVAIVVIFCCYMVKKNKEGFRIQDQKACQHYWENDCPSDRCDWIEGDEMSVYSHCREKNRNSPNCNTIWNEDICNDISDCVMDDWVCQKKDDNGKGQPDCWDFNSNYDANWNYVDDPTCGGTVDGDQGRCLYDGTASDWSKCSNNPNWNDYTSSSTSSYGYGYDDMNSDPGSTGITMDCEELYGYGECNLRTDCTWNSYNDYCEPVPDSSNGMSSSMDSGVPNDYTETMVPFGTVLNQKACENYLYAPYSGSSYSAPPGREHEACPSDRCQWVSQGAPVGSGRDYEWCGDQTLNENISCDLLDVANCPTSPINLGNGNILEARCNLFSDGVNERCIVPGQIPCDTYTVNQCPTGDMRCIIDSSTTQQVCKENPNYKNPMFGPNGYITPAPAPPALAPHVTPPPVTPPAKQPATPPVTPPATPPARPAKQAAQNNELSELLQILLGLMNEDFKNFNRLEHFSSMYNSNEDGNFDVERPSGFNIVKLKKTNDSGALERLTRLIKTTGEQAVAKAGSVNTDQEFIDCLELIAKSMILKGMRSALEDSLSGYREGDPLTKCNLTSFASDCVYYSDTNPISAYNFSNNPIDGFDNSIAKNISNQLSRIFKNEGLPDVLLEKITGSALNSAGKLVMLENLKNFINQQLETLTNEETDSFYIYYRVDYSYNPAASNILEKINFEFITNPAGHSNLNLISSESNAPEPQVVDADCVVNWGQWSNCQADALSTCVATPHVPGQFGARSGFQQRESQIITPQRGNGLACPLAQSEVRSCSVPCEDPLEDSNLQEILFSDFKNNLRINRNTVRCDVYRSRDEARYLNNSLGRMTVSVDNDNNFIRSYIPNRITQDCNNLNISTLYLRTLSSDGNYTDTLVLVNPKTEYCTGNPHGHSNLDGSLCSDSCNFIKSNSENTGQCLNRCVTQSNCEPSCCASACMKQGAIVENFESASICSYQPYGRTLDECKENCKNDGCDNIVECNRLCGECRSISCRWTLPDFNGVSEKPSSPNIIATPGNNSATIIWNRSDDRGSRIERYIVVAYETTNPESGVRIELATNPSCTNCIHRIDNLKNNLSYTVGVSAVNSGGVSKMSNTVVVIPSMTSVDMSFVQSIQKDAIAHVKTPNMLKKTIDKIILQRGNIDEQLLGELLTYRNQPEDKTLKDLLTKLAGSTIEITI